MSSMVIAAVTLAFAASADTPMSQLLIPKMPLPSGTVIVMVGADSCRSSVAFRPVFEDNLPLSWATKIYLDKSQYPDEIKYYPTPMFILYRDQRPVDFHVGVVGAQNQGAADANSQIFSAIAARNRLGAGSPWMLSANKPTFGQKSLDYRAVKFVTAEGHDFRGWTLKRAVFSDARFPRADFTDAVFEATIFAHVDATDATITEAQARNIIWFGSICPDGARSEDNGGTCANHLKPRPAPHP